MKNLIHIPLFLLFFSCSHLFAQAGIVDSSFGTNGVLYPSQDLFYGRMESYNCLAVQPDGKFLLTGTANGDAPNFSDIALIRCLPNGQRDPGFGTDGLVRTDLNHSYEFGRGLCLQADGKILVVAGTESDKPSCLLRYNANGSPDAGFGTGGQVFFPLIGAPTFTYNDLYSVAVQADGKILVAGSVDNGYLGKFFLLRFNANGTPDLDFGDNGLVLADVVADEETCRDLAIQTDGKIVLAGYAQANGYNPRFTVLRFTADGELDPDFGNGQGFVITEIPDYIDCWCYSVKIQNDGKIVAVGAGLFGLAPTTIDNILVRYQPDGTLDETFGDNGIVITYFDNILECWSTNLDIQTDGKLIVNGYCRSGFDQDLAIYRYNPDGSLDQGFGLGGYNLLDLGSYQDNSLACAISGDKLLVAGNRSEEYYAVVRYQLEGSSATQEPASAQFLRAYPNPSNGRTVTLDFDLPQASRVTVEMNDLYGRPLANLWTGFLPQGKQSRTFTLPQGCPKGLYNFSVTTDFWKNSVKLMVIPAN